MIHQLFSNNPTTTRSSTRLLLSISASLNWEVRTRDISQAFVFSEYDLLRKVFNVPPKEAKRPKDELWRLRRHFIRSIVRFPRRRGSAHPPLSDRALFYHWLSAGLVQRHLSFKNRSRFQRVPDGLFPSHLRTGIRLTERSFRFVARLPTQKIKQPPCSRAN